MGTDLGILKKVIIRKKWPDEGSGGGNRSAPCGFWLRGRGAPRYQIRRCTRKLNIQLKLMYLYG